MVQIWWSQLERMMSYRADKRTHGLTHTYGHTHRQTQATTIPEGQNWPRVKSIRSPYDCEKKPPLTSDVHRWILLTNGRWYGEPFLDMASSRIRIDDLIRMTISSRKVTIPLLLQMLRQSIRWSGDKWWRHMETLYVLMPFCDGIHWCILNNLLKKWSSCRWLETLCEVIVTCRRNLSGPNFIVSTGDLTILTGWVPVC